MTRLRSATLLAVGLGVAAATLGLALLMGAKPEIHKPGAGPLTALGDAWTMGLDPTHRNKWTLGIYLCATDPASAPVLDAVTPSDTLGSFEFLGASIREFAPSNSHPPILSTDGYPPAVSDTLQPLPGHRVAAGCSQEAEFADYNELLLGIGQQGPSGGGWRGERVAYHVGDRKYVLALEYVVMVCGPVVPDSYCKGVGVRPMASPSG